MNICPDHGSIPAGPRYCTDCGKQVIPEPKCPYCSQPMHRTDKYCGSCGAKVNVTVLLNTLENKS